MKKIVSIGLILTGVALTGCPNIDFSSVKADVAEGFTTMVPPQIPLTALQLGPVAAPPGEQADRFSGVFLPGRQVTLSPYKIAATEVTVKLWKEVYEWATGAAGGVGQPAEKYTFANSGEVSSDTDPNRPITGINWLDAVVWCNAYTERLRGLDECVYVDKKGKILKDSADTDKADQAKMRKKKKGFRLPTEAEWEYAARWQRDNRNANAVAYGKVWLIQLDYLSGASGGNYTNEEASLRVAVFKVGDDSDICNTAGKHPNAANLYDMSGNAEEWCFDRGGRIDATEKVKDPTGSPVGESRISRGGSALVTSPYCVVGYRSACSWSAADPRRGFRLAYNI